MNPIRKETPNMRKSALAASTLAAFGLMAVGGTAFADGGQTAPADGEGTNSTSQQDQKTVAVVPNHNTQSQADASRSVVGLNVPVNADLHEGVLNESGVLGQSKSTGDTKTADVPAVVNAANGTANNVKAPIQAVPVNVASPQAKQSASTATANANGNGTDAVASANAVGDTVNNVVATATATVHNTVGGNLVAPQGGYYFVQGS
jgi:hypothetical protein